MINNTNLLKFFSILTIFVLIATFYPPKETKAFIFDFVTEIGPNLFVNAITSGVEIAMQSYDTYIKPAMLAIAKAAIRAVIADLKNQTIRWIVTGQFGKPQFVTNFQADPRKIAENASKIFLSRLTNINFCQYQPPIYNDNLLFSANLNVNLECSVDFGPGTSNKIGDLTAFARDFRKGGWFALWGVTDPQNNYWDVKGRTIAQKQINEQRSLAAWYNELITNQGVRGKRDSKGNIITPGQYIADAMKESVHQDYPTLDQIDEWSGIIQAIGEIVNAGLKQAISTGLDKAFH